MRGELPETLFIYEKLFSNIQKRNIRDFLDEIEIKKEKYETADLWLVDKKIGGIGGYCMPSDPRFNYYPVGINRELFRPLQYVRAEIDLSDIRMHARQVVHYSGMHLEAVLRLFIKNTRAFGNIRFHNSTLGKATHEISKMNVFDNVIIEALFKFVTLYNKAKHEVNMIEERPRMFSESDAIVCYFCARIIGQAVLLKLQYPLSLKIHDINNEVYNY